MIRICHVQLLPIMSGVQRSMLETFKQLDRARYQIHVVCKEPGPLTDELFRLKIPVHFVPALRPEVHPWSDYRASRELRRIFAKNQFEIVHTYSSKPGYLGRLAARRAGVPIVIHQVRAFAFHQFNRWPKRFLFSQLEHHAAHSCDCILFSSREERDLAVARKWIPPENAVTVYNGVDLQTIQPRNVARQREIQRAKWASSEDEFVVLYLGRLEPQKQPLLLAEIAARLDALRPRTSWRLLVAGSGSQESQLAQAAKTASLDHRVRMLGWQNDPLAVLYAADVVLLPSLLEGTSRALIEAQAAGLPVIASDISGNREVVTPGTGFLCPPKNPAGYANSLARLIDSPALRESLGQAARRHAEQCFDTMKNGRQIVSIYESLLSS